MIKINLIVIKFYKKYLLNIALIKMPANSGNQRNLGSTYQYKSSQSNFYHQMEVEVEVV